MKKNSKKDNAIILQDWLEFKTIDYAADESTAKKYVNVRRSEISEVIRLHDETLHADWCTVVMKNGNAYDVHMPYEEVMKIV